MKTLVLAVTAFLVQSAGAAQLVTCSDHTFFYKSTTINISDDAVVVSLSSQTEGLNLIGIGSRPRTITLKFKPENCAFSEEDLAILRCHTSEATNAELTVPTRVPGERSVMLSYVSIESEMSRRQTINTQYQGHVFKLDGVRADNNERISAILDLGHNSNGNSDNCETTNVN